MVDKSKVGPREGAPLWLRIHLQIREGEFSGLSPEFNGSFNLWCPKQVGLLRRLRRFWHHGRRTVHVIATNLMFSAVATSSPLADSLKDELSGLTIAEMSRHSGCASSCKFCILSLTWYGCALRDLHLGQPFRRVV